MLELKKIKKKYNDFYALDDLNMDIADGALFGLVGPNGAGKTSAIRVITGLMYPDSGSVMIDGIDAIKYPSKVKRLIGYVPDYFGVYDNLTVSEYMEFFATSFEISGLKARKRCMELLEQVELADKINYNVDSLSRGMQQRLCLARALIHDPKFLVMDEPTSGLDPIKRYEFKEILSELQAQGKTILISSHILSELAEICTDIGVIEQGRIILTGNVDEILSHIEHSNPLKIGVLTGVKTAMGIFKRNPCVTTISLSDKTFRLNFEGSREDEAMLLQQLIDADIAVNCFVREPGNLESFFMQITDHNEERIVLKNDY